MDKIAPTGTKRVALSASMHALWSQTAHVLFLDSLMKVGRWKPSELAFHGGTSLHLSWQSSRFSEDLDFLLARTEVDMKSVIEAAEKSIQAGFRHFDSLFEVSLKDKTKDGDRMLVYQVVVSHPKVVGNAMVKAEFWRTPLEYLKAYPTELRTPKAPMDYLGVMSYPVPAATLQTAFADKLVAFATRPHLKWRDIYDLWWIGTQSGQKLDMHAVCEQFLHNVTAYTTLGGLPPHEALAEFLKRDRAAVIKQADPDLRNWLPPDLWRALNPQGVEQMVDYVYATLKAVSDQVHELTKQPSTTAVHKPRRP